MHTCQALQIPSRESWPSPLATTSARQESTTVCFTPTMVTKGMLQGDIWQPNNLRACSHTWAHPQHYKYKFDATAASSLSFVPYSTWYGTCCAQPSAQYNRVMTHSGSKVHCSHMQSCHMSGQQYLGVPVIRPQIYSDCGEIQQVSDECR